MIPTVFQIGGSLAADSFYAERHADKELYDSLKAGELCYVFNSRQMGKSSLLLRCKRKLEKENYRCCFIDIGRIGNVNVSSEQWYAGILSELWRGFGLPPGKAMLAWWQEQGNLPPPQKLSLFLMEELLTHYPHQDLVIFLDEVDSVLSLPFAADDFFSVIRACYNHRSEDPRLKKIRFAFFGVALAADLIKDPSRTPFNIGKSIRLEGFTEFEAAVFSQGLQIKRLSPQALLKQIMWWTRGQPFLTQKLCHLVSCYAQDFAELNENHLVDEIVQTHILANWEANDHPEHLRTIRDRIQHDPSFGTKVLAQYLQILDADRGALPADKVDNYSRLYLTGLIAENHGILTPRTQIYETIFNRQWVLSELQSQRPYEQKMSLWEQSGHDPQWLLQGAELSNARQWTETRHLSEIDHRYLAASQELESEQFKKWNKQLQWEIGHRKNTEARLQIVLDELGMAKSDAEQANQAKSEFIARVSREVGTQVNSMLGLSYIAQQLDHPELSREYLQKNLNAASYMRGIVNSIIDIGRIEKGDLDFNTEVFNLDDVLDDLIDLVGFRLSRDNLQFHIDLPEEILPPLKGDPLRLKQLLLNLLLFCWSRCQGDTIRLAIVTKYHHDQGPSLDLTFTASYQGDMSPIDGPSELTTKMGSSSKTVGLILLTELTRLMGGKYSTSSLYNGGPYRSSNGNGNGNDSNNSRGDLSAIPETALDLALTFECEPNNNWSLPGKTVRVALALEPGSPLELARHIKLIGHHCQSVDFHKTDLLAFSHFDVLMVDTTHLALQSRLLSIMAANPSFKLMPVIAAGTKIPQWLALLNIRQQLVYPYSLSKLTRALDFSLPDIDNLLPLVEYSFVKQHHILIADNDELNQLIATELLLGLGLKVDVVASGREAVQAVHSKDYDLILLAVDMPFEAGLEVASDIRAMGLKDSRYQLESLPIIAMTSQAMASQAMTSQNITTDQRIMTQAGINDRLRLPLIPEAFVNILARWLPKVECKAQDLDAVLALELAGFDTKAGLTRCSGNLQLYLVALQQFAKEYCHGITVKKPDFQAMTVTFRGIKIMSTHVGANLITAQAAKLEATAKHGDFPEPGEIDTLSKQLIQLCEAIDRLSTSEA